MDNPETLATPDIQDTTKKFEDTKGVIRIPISKKNRQNNCKMKKYKRTNNNLQNIHRTNTNKATQHDIEN